MTGQSRRQWLSQMGLGTVGLVAGGNFAAADDSAGPSPDVALFDSGVPESCLFAAGAAKLIETGLQRSNRWFALRAATLQPGQSVAGLTTWSDWTVVRGMLSEKGLRVRSEFSRADGLFEWEMA